MKQIILAVAVIASVFISNIAGAQTRTPHINHKEARQNHRINKGIRHGSITRHEAHRLHTKQAELRGMHKMAMADGRVTHRERKMMRRQERQTGRMVYNSKHNNHNRGDFRFRRPGQQSTAPGYFN